MLEPHKTNIMGMCCRVCAVTAPKETIRVMQKFQADWLGLPHIGYRICCECSRKIVLYRENRFEDVYAHFGLPNGLISTQCSDLDPCWFCTKKIAYDEAVDETEQKKNTAALKKLFQDLINEHCPTIHLEPYYHKTKDDKKVKRVPNIYRINYLLEKQRFLWDKVCNSIFTYSKSSWSGMKRHLDSQAHRTAALQHAENEDNQIVMEEIPEIAPKFKPNGEQWSNFHDKMVGGLLATGKVAPYLFDQPDFRMAFVEGIEALGVDTDIKNVLPSRRKAMRKVDESAEQQRLQTKQDIADAIQADPSIQFSFLHDDGTLKNGMKENLRTFSVVWIDKNGMIQRRYLKSISAVSKATDSLKNSIIEVATEFGIDGRYIFLADGAMVNQSVARQLNVNLTICGPHTIHNSFRNSVENMASEEQAFQNFFGDIKQIQAKAARKHLNHKNVADPNWRKLKGYVETRWCSMIDCLDALLHNWELLVNEAIPVIQNHSRQLVEEFHSMLLPLKSSIISMEATKMTSGHLVAMELQCLLVYYINFSVDKSKPLMLQQLANKFVIQLEQYMDGVPSKRITKRICKIRLLQTAFYLPSGYLSSFDVTVDDIDKQESINTRYQRLQTELNEILLSYQTNETAQRRNSFGDTELGIEIKQFSMLATKYHENNDQLPAVVNQFKKDSLEKKDANLLFWNSDYATEYLPKLRAIIRPLLAISASTATVEGTFSFANHMRTSTRSRLETTTLDKFLTCRYARLNSQPRRQLPSTISSSSVNTNQPERQTTESFTAPEPQSAPLTYAFPPPCPSSASTSSFVHLLDL